MSGMLKEKSNRTGVESFTYKLYLKSRSLNTYFIYVSIYLYLFKHFIVYLDILSICKIYIDRNCHTTHVFILQCSMNNLCKDYF